jgi:hypothetical protein
MQRLIIELRAFLGLSEGESHHKGYFIPGKPGWARSMVSKRRADGLIESVNLMIFMDNAGHLLWHKVVSRKTQKAEEFERDLDEFKGIIEGAGMLIFIEDYSLRGGANDA